ncbi:MAG: RNA polymerase sigma factor [Weeksellaceae bacterium]|nr:RNA polymerase sigma factor [Weeksellaceae bacterium]
MAKIIDIQSHVPEWVEQAMKQDRKAQEQLFNHFAPKMLSVCRLYIHDLHFAEDVMIKAFFKAFTSLHLYREEGNFTAWLKTIMHRECISFLRSKTHSLQYVQWQESEAQEEYSIDDAEEWDAAILQKAIDSLPDGCKTVFNLYIFQQLKHKEIATELGITQGTSKSQLAYAKKIIKEKLQNLDLYAYRR